MFSLTARVILKSLPAFKSPTRHSCASRNPVKQSFIAYKKLRFHWIPGQARNDSGAYTDFEIALTAAQGLPSRYEDTLFHVKHFLFVVRICRDFCRSRDERLASQTCQHGNNTALSGHIQLCRIIV